MTITIIIMMTFLLLRTQSIVSLRIKYHPITTVTIIPALYILIFPIISNTWPKRTSFHLLRLILLLLVSNPSLFLIFPLILPLHETITFLSPNNILSTLTPSILLPFPLISILNHLIMIHTHFLVYHRLSRLNKLILYLLFILFIQLQIQYLPV